MQKSISIEATDTNTFQKSAQIVRWFVYGTDHSNGYSAPRNVHDVLMAHQEGFEDNLPDGVSPHSEHNPLRVLLQKDHNLLFLKTDESWSFG